MIYAEDNKIVFDRSDYERRASVPSAPILKIPAQAPALHTNEEVAIPSNSADCPKQSNIKDQELSDRPEASPESSENTSQVKIEAAKKQCEDLGFKKDKPKAAEKYGECVLKLSK